MKSNAAFPGKSLVGVLIGLLLVAALVSPVSAAAPPPVNALVIVQGNSIAEMDRAIVFIREHGGQVPVTIAPNALFAVLPAVDSSSWIGQAGIRLIVSTPVDADEITARYGEQAGLAARVWNQKQSEARAPLTQRPGADMIGDALVAPDAPLRDPSAPLAPPVYWQTSEFLYGTVQVDVFLPESDGSVDPSTRDWTTGMRDNVASKVTAGVNWWATTATQGGRPSANLSFNLTFHTPFNEPAIVATGYEPITRNGPLCSDLMWIGDIMNHLGYSADCTGVRSYLDARRIATGRDWAFAVFVANSLYDSDGKFLNGRFAYSYLNGPFMVQTYDNDSWYITRMDIVTAHEMGHTFGALDEYATSGCYDTETGGYLNIANTNCENGTPATEDSIMRNASNQQIAYPNHQASTPVRGMLGWRDSDVDGIYDVVDTDVLLSATLGSGGTGGEPAAFSGTATDIPWDSFTRVDVSINVIASVQFRVDGGAWLDAMPSDGAFDQYTESFTATTVPLVVGEHTIDIRSCNTVGNCSTWTDTLTVSGAAAKTYLPSIVR